MVFQFSPILLKTWVRGKKWHSQGNFWGYAGKKSESFYDGIIMLIPKFRITSILYPTIIHNIHIPESPPYQ